MILFELTETEDNPVYRKLEAENGMRQYDFLCSIVEAAISAKKDFISAAIIKALNFHAIACLHSYAGEYRPCGVRVGDHNPPEFFQVDARMNDFINTVNRLWEKADPISLAAYALWRLNHIHPFINGNGRTARAVCYFILCMKLNTLLPGQTILPELIRQNRDRYVVALQQVDQSLAAGTPDLTPLHRLLAELLAQQVHSATPPAQPQ